MRPHLLASPRLISLGRRVGIAALLFTTFTCAQALTVVADEAAAKPLQCLVKSGNAPSYPEHEQERRLGGLVRVKLKFSHPARAPTVEVIFRSGTEDLVDQVELYVRDYRLPCLKPGQTVEAVQEFDFDANQFGKVHWNDLRHAPARSALAAPACIKTPDSQLTHFEDLALSSQIKRKSDGFVLARMRFTKLDEEPEVTVLYDNGNAGWRNSVLRHLADYRLTCPPPEGEAVEVEQQFAYRSSTRSQDVVLKDTGLVNLLRAVKDIDKQKVRFDLDSMGCPFDLVWSVGQPAFKNRVGELGPSNPNRLEFLAWLETLSLNVSPEVFDQVLGQKIKVMVPCGKINLGD